MIKLIIIIIVFIIYELICIDVPNNFEYPLYYRIYILFFKLLLLISIILSKLTKISEPIIIRNITNFLFYFSKTYKIKKDYLLNFINNYFKLHFFNKKKKINVSTKNYKIKDDVIIRVYKPKNILQINPCFIYFHGGGFFAGNIDMYDDYLKIISHKLNFIVISIDYKLSPENKFPSAINDSWKFIKFYIKHSSYFNADINNTIIGGDSAGANLTNVIVQKIIKFNKLNHTSFNPKLTIYITPFFQLFNLNLPSITNYHPKGLLSYFSFNIGKPILWYLGIENPDNELLNIFYNNLHSLSLNDNKLFEKYKSMTDFNIIPDIYKNCDYYNNKNNLFPQKDQEPIIFKNKNIKKTIRRIFNNNISPALVDDDILKKMPKKAYFIIYENDMLKDDALIFAKRLEMANIHVKIAFYDNCFHGQTQLVNKIDGYKSSRIILNNMINYIKNNL